MPCASATGRRLWGPPVAGLLALLVVGGAVTLSARAQEVPALGQHFIVLIDDSSAMSGQREALERVLPHILFDRTGQEESDGAPPQFDPHRDQVSVGFYGLRRFVPGGGLNDFPNPCLLDPMNGAVLPSNSFDFPNFYSWPVAADQPAGRDALERLLSELLSQSSGGRSCRFQQGPNPPFSTAETLALPAADRMLEGQGLAMRFGRVVLVNVSNLQGQPHPSAEIGVFATNWRIGGSVGALRWVEQVGAAFRFRSPESWVMTVNPRPGTDAQDFRTGFDNHFPDYPFPLRVRMTEAIPVGAAPSTLVSLPERVRLDREAVSNDRLRLVATDRQPLVLRIARAAGIVPDRLLVQVGRGEGPEPATQCRVELVPCSGGDDGAAGNGLVRDTGAGGLPEPCPAAAGPAAQPRCRVTPEALEVPLLPLIGLRQDYAPSEQTVAGAILRVWVGFRYVNGVYDHLYAWSEPRQVEVTVAALPVIPALDLMPPLSFPVDPWFPEDRLDDRRLAELRATLAGEQPLDGPTAVRLVSDRREQDQRHLRLGFVTGLVGLFGAGSIGAYHLATRRRFQPNLAWQPVAGVTIDFNAPSDVPLPLGSVRVENMAPAPRLGAASRQREPQRDAAFRLEGPEISSTLLIDAGRAAAGALVGFVSAGGDPKQLSGEIEQTVADHSSLILFLAQGQIRDLRLDGAAGPVVVDLNVSVDLVWPQRASDLGEDRPVRLELTVPVTIVPQRSSDPVVHYREPAESCVFRSAAPGSADPYFCAVGRFVFKSTVARRFAQPFIGDFTIQAEGKRGPLADGAVTIGPATVEVPPAATVERDICLVCDGTIVPNPPGQSDPYWFRLLGRTAPGSRLGPPGPILLGRDPTDCTATLFVTDGAGRRWEIVWDEAGGARRVLRRLPDGRETGRGADEETLAGNVFALDPETFSFREKDVPPTLFTLEIGNTGRNGKGTVAVDLVSDMTVDTEASGAIEFKDGVGLADLLIIGGTPHRTTPYAVLTEGGSAAHCTVELDTSSIRLIHGAALAADLLTLSVGIDMTIVTDRGRRSRRTLTFVMPVGLVQLPHPHWLCIDFGTSAIAAAIGDGREFAPIDLQRVIQRQPGAGGGAVSLATFDRLNSERGTPFLPSFIICDADQRPREASSDGRQPGFPGYAPGSFRPGEPAFIGLPATKSQVHERPRRVVYSLKSWLGRSSPIIPLDDAVPIERQGSQVRTNRLPLDALVESGFAALAEAYVRPHGREVGQVVVTYPNTFSIPHRERLHRAACKALMPRLNIPLPDRVKLLSESDAVAYYYTLLRCNAGTPPSGEENILVYDFGAGTLDLSVIRVVWSSGDVVFPELWEARYRLGVAVAGNHLDSILARLAHELLRDDRVAPPEFVAYRFPVVAAHHVSGKESQHNAAIRGLWLEIRAAKQGDGATGWNGTDPFRIAVADPLAGQLVGEVSEDIGPWVLSVVPAQARALRERFGASPPPGEAGLVYATDRQDGDRLELHIPAQRIHSYPALQTFLDFVTTTVIDETLAGAGLSRIDVTTVVISGRGALWPGLRERIQEVLPLAELRGLPEDNSSTVMKEAVVRGAIAWQSLGEETRRRDLFQPQLAVLLEQTRALIPESRWKDGPILFGGNSSFRVVQIAHRDPKPIEDEKDPLRRQFYVDLEAERFRRDAFTPPTDRFFIERQTRDGRTTIVLRGGRGKTYTINAEGSSGADAIRPPWPIGRTLLSPEDGGTRAGERP